MIAVVQRVSAAEVTVDDPPHRAAIARGLCVLLAVEPGDDEAAMAWTAHRLAALRIFPDDDGRMNRSVRDVGGSILLVSQFTLAGDCTKGNRPSFVGAAVPDIAEPLYRHCITRLNEIESIPTVGGVFGASMRVTLTNEGPVTLILERP